MPPINAKTAKVTVRRDIVARLYIRHQKASAIKRALESEGIVVDVSTVHRDIQYLENLWRKELIDDPVVWKAKELQEIETAEAECWLQYSASRETRWLAELRGWKERKHKLLGLDPTRKQPGETPDQPLYVAPVESDGSEYDHLTPEQIQAELEDTLARLRDQYQAGELS